MATENAQSKNEECTANYLIRITDASIKMENDRYDSFTSLNTRLLTCVSILAVAVMAALNMIAGALIQCNLGASLASVTAFVMLFLAAALLFALLAQIRFPYLSLNAPGEYLKAAVADEDNLPSQVELAKLYVKAHDELFYPLRKRNERIGFYLRISLGCLIASLASIALGSIVIIAQLVFC